MNPSLPSQAKAGPRCPKCGEEMQGGFFRTSVNSASAIKWRCKGNDESFHEFIIDCSAKLQQFFQLPAPAALSVEECTREITEKIVALHLHVWQGLKQAMVVYSDAIKHGIKPCDCDTAERHYVPESALPAASTPAEVPFSLPLRAGNGPNCDIWDSAGKFSVRVYGENREELEAKQAYVISAVNSHEELKRQCAMLIETLAVSPVTCYMCETEGNPVLHNGKWVHAHGDIGLRDCLSPALRAESPLSLNAELREALKAVNAQLECLARNTVRGNPHGFAVIISSDVREQVKAVLSKAEKAVRP